MTTEIIEHGNNKAELLEQNESEAKLTRKVFSPRTDIYESAENLILLADMPGVKQENIDITLEQNILTINARVEAQQYPGYSLVHAEYSSGDFRRVFALSNEIDRDGIQATVRNGVLRLVLPKSKGAVPRKIAVSAS